jgi:hypothetical protein
MRTALLLTLAACSNSGLGESPLDETALDETFSTRTTCPPDLTHSPVGDAHNLGYDGSSCGSGTCTTSCDGENANSDWGGNHHGMDIFAYQGAPILAVSDGIIRRVGVVSSTSGLRIRLRDSCGWEYYYGHLDQAFVQPGDAVTAGMVIGTMGRTGAASTHLHFNVSPNGAYSNDIDPLPLLLDVQHSACDLEPVPDDLPPDCGDLATGTDLDVNVGHTSCDGRTALVMQGDGNLVLYGPSGALWHTGTHGNPGASAWLQDDGNLVVYSATGTPLWHAGTHGNPDARLAVQDDGNLVLYSSGGGVLWHTGTQGG